MMSGSNNEVLMYAIVLGAIFFIFILPRIEKKYNQEEDEMKKQVVEKMTSLLKAKKDNILKLDRRKCSRDCCLHTQWPAPHMPEKKSDKYIGSNFMCNGNGGGCLCVSKEDTDYLAERGYNNRPCHKEESSE